MDPSTVLQQLLNSGAVRPQAFGPQSRYYPTPILTRTTPGGEPIHYVGRRFIPPPEDFALLQRHRVRQGDRIDVVAGTILGDPLAYWQICDANLALDPADVVAVPGSFIVVTLPAGVPGA